MTSKAAALALALTLTLSGCMAQAVVQMIELGVGKPKPTANPTTVAPPSVGVLATLSKEELTGRAERGDLAAQYVLAWQSTFPEPRRYWLCRSAANPHPLRHDALFSLGRMNEHSNTIAAYSYFMLAKQYGSDYADERLNALRPTMTAANIADAEKVAAVWHPGNCGDAPPAG